MDLSVAIGENYAVLRNSSRIRGSASLPRKSKDESSINISSPKNGEGSHKSGRSRKKQKSGNESNINASFSTRNRQSNLTVSKIIKLNRKVINNEPPRKPRANDTTMENVNVSKSLENASGSSGFIHLNNIHTSDIVHAVQRFSEQPISMKRAV